MNLSDFSQSITISSILQSVVKVYLSKTGKLLGIKVVIITTDKFAEMALI